MSDAVWIISVMDASSTCAKHTTAKASTHTVSGHSNSDSHGHSQRGSNSDTESHAREAFASHRAHTASHTDRDKNTLNCASATKRRCACMHAQIRDTHQLA
eukprot:6189217-Pleurochrysis_carterae.AAC.6